MSRILMTLLTLAALMSTAYAETPPTPAAAAHALLFSSAHPDNHFVRSLAATGAAHPATALTCCKVCSVGKACGNTCISRDKTCHVGQGCACDG